ncbi:hypothetical protein [Burkholderia anthina]|uniref:hypothetical protein n=1 Tax=Burkholderia anthina TaxID=179879 RepID=UPI001AA082F7|nr:hypothetical protein [Burkholderia anthina]QTD91354.1 hypothetical protein J4G50_08270 [Burkholderia anthina]QTD95164.1 hypothetical protein J4G50_34725 [Burkholderia anthina]
MAMLAFVVKLVVMLLAVLTRAFVVILAARTMLVVFTHSHCSLKSSSSVNFSGADRGRNKLRANFYHKRQSYIDLPNYSGTSQSVPFLDTGTVPTL